MTGRLSLLAVAVVAACATTPDDAAGSMAEPPPLDPIVVAAGRVLYDAQCASCHGLDLAGAADWKVPLPTGGYPPPPHDSTGHTWHHPDRVLGEIITDPSTYGLTMPPASLDPDEITAVLAYFKSTWGPEERQFQWERTLADEQ